MLNPTTKALSGSTTPLVSGGDAPLPPLPLPFVSPLFVLQEGDRFAALQDLARAVLRSTPPQPLQVESGIEAAVELQIEQWAEGLAQDVIAAND